MLYALYVAEHSLEVHSFSRVLLQASKDNIDQFRRIYVLDLLEVVLDLVIVHLEPLVVVVELGIVQEDQLQHHHPDREHVSSVHIELDLVMPSSHTVQLLRCQQELIKLPQTAKSLKIAIMPVLCITPQLPSAIPIRYSFTYPSGVTNTFFNL